MKSSLPQIIEETYPKVYAFAFRKTGDVSLANDLTQETFLRFFEHYDTYVPQGKLLHYLFRILVNLNYDELRIQGKLTEEQEGIASCNPEQEIVFKEQERNLKIALQQLTEEERTIVILRFYHNLKFRELAAILEMPASTIKSKLNVILKKLKKELGEWK